MAALIYPLLALLAISKGGWWSWIGLPFNLLVVPLLDHVIRASFPPLQRAEGFSRTLMAHEAWMWMASALHLGVFVIFLLEVGDGVDVVTFLGLASTVGISGGSLAITAAHEMVHRRSPVQRTFGLSLLASVLYMHFRIEHVYGHHRHVGTERDLATARAGECFYGFFNRAITRGWSSAWRIETHRLRRRGTAAWHWSNRMISYGAMEAALVATIALALGPVTAAAFAMQAFVAVHLLEATNYVQHYGLTKSDGCDRAGAEQCWESDFPLSNILLFNLPVHGIHHEDPSRRYGELRLSGRARMLPASFHIMVFSALIPPLWHRLMDRRLAADALPPGRIAALRA